MVPCAVSPPAATSPTWIVPLGVFAEPLPVATLVSPAVIETAPLVELLLPPAPRVTPFWPPTLALTPLPLGWPIWTPPLPALTLPAGVLTLTPPLVGAVVVVVPPAGCVDGV